MAEEAESQRKSHRFGSLIVPCLLLLAIAGWAWLSRTTPAAPVAIEAATGVPATTASEPEATAEVGLVGLATPWAVAGAEPGEVSPTPPPTATGAPEPITLLGPPAGSLFRDEDLVSFYWQWPRDLMAGERFIVYVGSAGPPVVVAEVDAPNLGAMYQAQTTAGSVMAEAGASQWWVVLQNGDGATLGQSAPRPIGTVGG